MATYKMIQDIEAEDHILGPLTLRQFIFAIFFFLFAYICFILVKQGVSFLLVLFLPPALFFGFFAIPFGKDQPTEVWALAKIRYYIKPRRRIWDQSGIKELVTITVPKKIERELTNGLSQTEVQSRLSALANTIDSRGWAIKNVNVSAYAKPNPLMANDSDRLIDINNLPREVPTFDVAASDDILDETSNPVAQQFDQMINQSSQAHRQQLIDEMNGVRERVAGMPPAQPADYWFMNQPAATPNLAADQAVFGSAPLVLPGVPSSQPQAVAAASGSSSDEAALGAQLKASHNSQQVSYAHLRTLQPLGSNPQPVAAPVQPMAPVINTMPTPITPPTPAPAPVSASSTALDPAILSLSQNNDLDVATLARQAHKAEEAGGNAADGEVVVPLR